MSTTLRTLFNICLLRQGPEALPCSRMLLGALLVISFMISVLIGGMIYSVKAAVLSSVAGLFVSFAFAKILLLKKPERFLQTFSAMLGTVTLINIVSLPSSYSLQYLQLGETAELFFGVTGLALFVWVVIVYGYIFSRALSSAMSYGVAISVGYALLHIIVLEMFISASLPG